MTGLRPPLAEIAHLTGRIDRVNSESALRLGKARAGSASRRGADIRAAPGERLMGNCGTGCPGRLWRDFSDRYQSRSRMSRTERTVNPMTEESDDFQKLMGAVLKGDGEALASLFSLYRDRLRRMVELRLDTRLRGRVSASDILQEAYIGALQRLPHYQASTDIPLFVWLRSVTMQRLIDAHRRHLGGQVRDASREIRLGRVDVLEAGSGQIAELFADTTSPSLAARRGEILAIVRAALEQLDPIDREVLVLRHFEQMSNHEAAAALAIKTAAASKRYVRAVERLKCVLEQIPGLDGETT